MALGIDYNSGIPHTNGMPVHDPGTNGGKLAYDHVNRVKYKWVSGTTWEVDASGGGGGDSLGTGFTAGGGEGAIPDGTVATLDGSFEIDTDFAGFVSKLIKNQAGYGDDNNLFGFYQSDDGFFGSVQNNAGDANFEILGRFSDASTLETNFRLGYSTVEFRQVSGGKYSRFRAIVGRMQFTSTLSADGSFSDITLDGKLITITGSAGADPFLGATYGDDYSANIATNDRSIPDVGTLKAGLIPHMPRQVDNATALNGETFYSTNNSKLCFKDLGGTVNDLY